MLYLKQSIKAWDTDSFKDVLIKELRSIDAGDNISAIILCTEDNNGQLQVKAGLFYSGIIAGCNCADDPTPVDEINEYCEVLLAIDKKTALTTVSLIK